MLADKGRHFLEFRVLPNVFNQPGIYDLQTSSNTAIPYDDSLKKLLRP